jgi:hypothetical protein
MGVFTMAELGEEELLHTRESVGGERWQATSERGLNGAKLSAHVSPTATSMF